jgi:hypothetical protein
MQDSHEVLSKTIGMARLRLRPLIPRVPDPRRMIFMPFALE